LELRWRAFGESPGDGATFLAFQDSIFEAERLESCGSVGALGWCWRRVNFQEGVDESIDWAGKLDGRIYDRQANAFHVTARNGLVAVSCLHHQKIPWQINAFLIGKAAAQYHGYFLSFVIVVGNPATWLNTVQRHFSLCIT